jgi:regulator of replication initiation timing
MHENALLRAENQDLQQANEDTKLAAEYKKNRLQKRVMTVEEGRQEIGQMNVGGQVVE